VGTLRYFFVVLLPILLCGHAVVSPGTSRRGAYERYVLRVPNEGDTPTIRVEIRFPPEVRVISFADVPGWQVEAVMDSTDRATSAVWTGTLPPHRFVEFPFIGVNPKGAATLVWPVIQTYAGGVKAEWTGPRDSDSPASVTVIGAESSSAARRPVWIAIVALAVALGALVSARRRQVA
jgi:uncharacterized protein DUF1775